jgi:hypothetical protein
LLARGQGRIELGLAEHFLEAIDGLASRCHLAVDTILEVSR